MQAYLLLIGDSEWGPLTVGGVDGVHGGRGGKVPDGLRYHVLDVWVDGLESVAGEMDQENLEQLLGPVRRLANEGKTKVLRQRAKGVLGDERLQKWMAEGGKDVENIQPGDQQAGSDEEWGGFGD